MKKIISLISIVFACTLLLCGCEHSQNAKTAKQIKVEKAKKVVENTHYIDKEAAVLTDSKTGVEYFYFENVSYKGRHVAITPRLDREGKPYININYLRSKHIENKKRILAKRRTK